jgi:D-alanyl-D-alanine carboxypeptidase
MTTYSRSDYGTNPNAGKSRNNAAERGWGAGWPNAQTARMAKVGKAGVTVYVRREIAPLVAVLLDNTERLFKYDIKKGQTWGFANRPIRGTRTPSNHSWGLAVDINSLCLAGDTRVLTLDGVRAIRDLAADGEARLLVRDPFTGRTPRWADVPIRSYGVQPVSAVIVSRYGRHHETIKATANHRWFVYRETTVPRADRPGQYKAARRVVEVTTDQLQVGDRLVMATPRSEARRSIPSSIGVAHGIVFGDGALTRTSGAVVDLFGPKNAELLRFFPEPVVNALADTPGGVTRLRVSNLPRAFKRLPELSESTQYLVGWLAGYFAADGCVAENGSPSMTIADEHVADYRVESVVPEAGEEEVFCPTVEPEGAFALDGWLLTGNSNPMGSRFVTDIPPAVVAMWEACGLYWGGRYQKRPDAMHFEYIGRPRDVAADLLQAQRWAASTPRAAAVQSRSAAAQPRGAAAAPSRAPTAVRDVTITQRAVQMAVNGKPLSGQYAYDVAQFMAFASPAGLKAIPWTTYNKWRKDRSWARGVWYAVVRVQQIKQLKVDGIFGPRTAKAVEKHGYRCPPA